MLKAAKGAVADHDETQHTKDFFADADSEFRFVRITTSAKERMCGMPTAYWPEIAAKLAGPILPAKRLWEWQNSTAGGFRKWSPGSCLAVTRTSTPHRLRMTKRRYRRLQEMVIWRWPSCYSTRMPKSTPRLRNTAEHRCRQLQKVAIWRSFSCYLDEIPT
jgi:hypothetical protein